LNIEGLSGFVALGCKSARAGLSHTSFKVARIPSLLAQIEQVKLVFTKLQVNSHFSEGSKCGFVTDGDIVNLFAFFAVLFRV